MPGAIAEPLFVVGDVQGCADELSDLLKAAAHSQQQTFTRLGRRDAPRGAIEQPEAESRLEPSNRVAQRRLRNPELCSRLGEAALSRYSEECQQVIKVFARHL